MDKNKELALELAKALIQNNNVKPVFGNSNNQDESNSITYTLGNVNYSFIEIATNFLDNVKKFDDFY